MPGFKVVPNFTESGHGNRGANAGAAYSLLPDIPCSYLELRNRTGVDIVFQQDAAGIQFPLADGEDIVLVGINNCKQIGVKRLDSSATATPGVFYRWAR